jgi:hypothetical protein
MNRLEWGLSGALERERSRVPEPRAPINRTELDAAWPRR